MCQNCGGYYGNKHLWHPHPFPNIHAPTTAAIAMRTNCNVIPIPAYAPHSKNSIRAKEEFFRPVSRGMESERESEYGVWCCVVMPCGCCTNILRGIRYHSKRFKCKCLLARTSMKSSSSLSSSLCTSHCRCVWYACICIRFHVAVCCAWVGEYNAATALLEQKQQQQQPHRHHQKLSTFIG